VSRIILACAVAGILGVPAKADETLTFRIIAHPTSIQTQNVGDVDGHALLLARLNGLATFPNGSLASVYWTTQGDYTNGAGPGVAYVSVDFRDGSAFWYKATGSTDSTNIFKGSVTVISGKGRFEGAKGDGTVAGGRVGPPGPNADVFFDLSINIKK
jgi:hypothetical protein